MGIEGCMDEGMQECGDFGEADMQGSGGEGMQRFRVVAMQVPT